MTGAATGSAAERGVIDLLHHSTARPSLSTIVADDFRPARQLLVDALQSTTRFTVVSEAADGMQALDSVRAHHPDLALLDLAMPIAGGLDVIGEINDTSPATRVVIVSGFPGRDLEEQVAAHGAAGYVRKRSSIRAVLDDVVAAAGLLDVAGLVLAETRRFGRDLRAAGEARHFVAEVLDRWDCRPALDIVRLLLTEVVANAVLHGDSAPEVAVRLLDDCVRIEVGDDSPAMPVLMLPDQPVEWLAESLEEVPTSGRGLRILASEARDWGIAARPEGGKVVWFDVPRFE